MEAKRQRIMDLSHAQVPVGEIMRTVGVSRTTVLAYYVDEVPPINTTKHPQSAMMLGVVASDGKRMPPYWFPKGLKVGTEEYLEVMQRVVKPWIDQNFEGIQYVWQQDSAPGHKAKKTQ